ncbi:hypothetical protein DYD21_06805 [Rhodohalobacter sp. SW132]|nr:hypothetical protein DYD21_06805 [Rhodohalobacter sp. SW132]
MFAAGLIAEPRDTSVQLHPIGGNLDGATSISIIPSGEIYITERGKHRLLKLNRLGTRIDSVGSQGRSDYRFDRPVSVNATNGLKIYVADQNNERVQMFDRRHQYLSTISADIIDGESRLRPVALTVSRTNDLYVYDSERFKIFVFDNNGNQSGEINLRQHGIRSVDQMKISGPELLLFDAHNGVIHRFRSDGSYLNFISGFAGALAIFGTDQHIWSLYNDRIVQKNQRGSLVATFTIGEPVQSASDLAIRGSRAYILTPSQLWTATL